MADVQVRKDVALDACLDLLLDDSDWSEALPAEDPMRSELVGLMLVAQRLRDLARRAPRLHPDARRRLWRRWVRQTLHIASPHNAPLRLGTAT